jgi:hypothetical protein
MTLGISFGSLLGFVIGSGIVNLILQIRFNRDIRKQDTGCPCSMCRFTYGPLR